MGGLYYLFEGVLLSGWAAHHTALHLLFKDVLLLRFRRGRVAFRHVFLLSLESLKYIGRLVTAGFLLRDYFILSLEQVEDVFWGLGPVIIFLLRHFDGSLIGQLDLIFRPFGDSFDGGDIDFDLVCAYHVLLDNTNLWPWDLLELCYRFNNFLHRPF